MSKISPIVLRISYIGVTANKFHLANRSKVRKRFARMSYQILARKHRPQSFDEVIGQEPVVQTLKNAIQFKRLHQAYLFSGSRGVGKTSLARILAKSLNCEKGSTVTPCQTCSPCVEITQGKNLDVQEIDGASNTGVDDVRALREQVKYVPISGKYKIYIIDEVHMLSQSAFNALLKTLEEPPPHVLFIFATTEPHKIPVTILSRCQRFDFKRVPVTELIAHMTRIASADKINVSESCLGLIASASEGSVRDSLSLLDQALSFCGDAITEEKLRDLLGLSDPTLISSTLTALLDGKAQPLFDQMQIVLDKGVDLKFFCENLLEWIRGGIVCAEGGEKYLDCPQAEMEELKKVAAKSSSLELLKLFQILLRTAEEVARSSSPRLIFETGLIKLLHARELTPISEAISRLQQGNGLPSAIAIQPRAPHPAPSPRPASSVPSGATGGTWDQFVEKAKKTRPQIASILEHARPIIFKAGVIELGFEQGSVYLEILKERQSLVEDLAASFFGSRCQLNVKTLTGSENAIPTVSEIHEDQEKERSASLKARVLKDSAVQLAQEVLGARVQDVKELKG